MDTPSSLLDVVHLGLGERLHVLDLGQVPDMVRVARGRHDDDALSQLPEVVDRGLVDASLLGDAFDDGW